MSIFPSRLRPGGTITIHLRYRVTRPVWILKASIVAPDDSRIVCLERYRLLVPPTPQSDLPLVVAARELGHYDLKEMLESTHCYATYSLPEDAALGRYRLELETTMDGTQVTSATAASDCFYVEKLTCEEVISAEQGQTARVSNRSPEPVAALLYQYPLDRDADSNPNVVAVHLPPQATSQLDFSGNAVLVYADGTEVLPLTQPQDPFCMRHPGLPSLVRPDGSTCVLLESEALKLAPLARDIWQRAHGFATRSMIRDAANNETYDRMMAHGLIAEVTID